MNKLLVFIGDSGSGKTTLITELTKEYPERFKKIVTCTDRHPRDGEIDGVDYHFLSTEYFRNNSDLVLKNIDSQGLNYGVRKPDLFSNTHHLLIALRPLGVSKLMALGLKNIVIVQLLISPEEKIRRMRQRGDSEEMILARVKFESESRAEVAWGKIPIITLKTRQVIDRRRAIARKINLILKHVGD